MHSKISEEQRVFNMFVDQNGTIPAEKVPLALRCLGHVVKGREWRPVDMGGFKACLCDAANMFSSREAVKDAFQAMDPEGSGYASASELQTILADGEDALPAEDINCLMGMFAPDDRGMVCYNLLIEKLFSH
ncbi:calmodulin [Pancytospora philotis]|nr:calmodulin [Pancytospora philotis]